MRASGSVFRMYPSRHTLVGDLMAQCEAPCLRALRASHRSSRWVKMGKSHVGAPNELGWTAYSPLGGGR